MRERAATFAPVEGRAIEYGDFAQVKLLGTPEGGGDPLQAESVLAIGAERDDGSRSTPNLKGANAAIIRILTWTIRPTIPIQKLGGKKYHYAVEVLGIKTKKLPN